MSTFIYINLSKTDFYQLNQLFMSFKEVFIKNIVANKSKKLVFTLVKRHKKLSS